MMLALFFMLIDLSSVCDAFIMISFCVHSPYSWPWDIDQKNWLFSPKLCWRNGFRRRTIGASNSECPASDVGGTAALEGEEVIDEAFSLDRHTAHVDMIFERALKS